jgi:hypothetical protein
MKSLICRFVSGWSFESCNSNAVKYIQSFESSSVHSWPISFHGYHFLCHEPFQYSINILSWDFSMTLPITGVLSIIPKKWYSHNSPDNNMLPNVIYMCYSWRPDIRSCIHLNKVTKQQWFTILWRGWLNGVGGWVVRRGSCVVGRASWVVRRGSCVVGRVSCVVGRGSWVVRRGSWVRCWASYKQWKYFLKTKVKVILHYE